MARQDYDTLLSIDEWAYYMGISPWEFNQVSEGFPRGVVMPCENVWYRHPWQHDFIAHEEVARAIDEAERGIAREIGYFFGPKFIRDEEVNYPHPGYSGSLGMGGDPLGYYKTVSLKWDKFLSGGIFARTVLPDVVVVYSDEDGDGIEDTFTCTVPVTFTDIAEMALYFVQADRMNEALGEDFRIRPIKVSIAGGTATITGHKALCIVPALHEGVNPQGLNVSTVANYITEVTPARVYIDTTYTTASPNQGSAVWSVPDDCEGDCEELSLPVCLNPVIPGQSVVRPQYGSPADWPYAWEADRLVVNYVAGVPYMNGRVRPDYARLIAQLATAYLPHEKCGCERAQRIMSHWRAKVNEGDSGRSFTTREIDSNPFGEPTLGALTVWKRIGNLVQTHLISVR